MAVGDISAVLGSLEFDTTVGVRSPWGIAKIADGIIAVPYESSNDDGVLKTFSVSADGTTIACIDTLTFDAGAVSSSSIIRHPGTDTYLLFTSMGPGLNVYTVDVDSAGNIGAAIIDSAVLDAVAGYYPRVCHISGNIFAVVYIAGGNSAELMTVDVAADGTINGAVDSWKFAAVNQGLYPSIQHISGVVYSLIATGTAPATTVVRTLNIAIDGTITKAFIDTETVAARLDFMNIVNTSGDVRTLLARVNGTAATTLHSYTINAAGAISAVIDTLVVDATSLPYCTDLQLVEANYVAAFHHEVDDDGFVSTYNVDVAGNIGAQIDILEYETDFAHWPTSIEVRAGLWVVAYEAADTDAWLKTFTIEQSAHAVYSGSILPVLMGLL